MLKFVNKVMFCYSKLDLDVFSVKQPKKVRPNLHKGAVEGKKLHGGKTVGIYQSGHEIITFIQVFQSRAR